MILVILLKATELVVVPWRCFAVHPRGFFKNKKKPLGWEVTESWNTKTTYHDLDGWESPQTIVKMNSILVGHLKPYSKKCFYDTHIWKMLTFPVSSMFGYVIVVQVEILHQLITTDLINILPFKKNSCLKCYLLRDLSCIESLCGTTQHSLAHSRLYPSTLASWVRPGWLIREII